MRQMDTKRYISYRICDIYCNISGHEAPSPLLIVGSISYQGIDDRVQWCDTVLFSGCTRMMDTAVRR